MGTGGLTPSETVDRSAEDLAVLSGFKENCVFLPSKDEWEKDSVHLGVSFPYKNQPTKETSKSYSQRKSQDYLEPGFPRPSVEKLWMMHMVSNLFRSRSVPPDLKPIVKNQPCVTQYYIKL